MDMTDQIMDDLAGLGEITARSMFGGLGLYRSETIFGILFRGRLYLKVDDRSREEFEVRGMEPFRPKERQVLKSYFEVPAEVLANPETLRSWAGEAIRAALGSQGPVR
jgi:DNA transformation protein